MKKLLLIFLAMLLVCSFNSEASTLTKRGGVNWYGGVKETWYDLPMKKVCEYAYNETFLNEEEHPYWVRDDGVKMIGEYVMCAADFDYAPRGTIVETSLGTGVVCDTGDMTGAWIDIAVDWK